MTEVIDGNAVAAEIREDLSDAISTLEQAGTVPGLATVLMSDDPASETYVSMKQRDCEEVGINGIHVELDNDAPADELYETIADLNADDEVHGILVQSPLVEQVNEREAFRAVAPEKDVDCFHPENVGRMVAGPSHARFKPCTPHGILKLLDHYDVETEGAEAVVVGRSNIVGKPMANLLAQNDATGNATVTVCHSRTEDLEAHTKNADIVVAAVGVPEFIDGTMLKEGATVIDVGINRVDAETEKGYKLVGDVEFASAREVADTITPVPGGVGPMTRAMLLWNTVKAASEQTGVDVDLP
ncbi:bifunctional 5,10-methylene-tetrahydrofolate dehydrogenase/5,10-methylene-tetrahydrofolate cyclohydrolase [Halosegnis rubeus]|jgi:methylenetetrahydrofolate dehydrogenase (NADP+)/methenyltetrahydrofolate cyclohydrolase|uniref:Bifunctional protein FolD n=1 Tax=Halosegnis rubeus TaxID=2212850 RepID=A0A5N5UND9_9EURY|nr:tetrahydrofolate dehydrogenase/cyclohydrolase catalytic domain-containing protein [Halosegnis rubeus]KAB7513885.1 bifunctional 5,10-methylene-tetrahydrofolate dehydrogenase/5,10-methylene-tetrahydrofolate cyclohydrolase [Halosegnis rubeus]KAB7514287.1 bifunctional 5,10-methylene-tetrahydrofolate dehydrogenase/5,10-methylene-tetrahydrofolate cyclohydrolase [Halosegnis rubeus]KAB7518863.1 bifunctional 5,10-methylene-tetrahydrofolate dehydrogenase/5,10-methylene-tetrahydrofolate cyclohydrolase [